MFNACIYSDLHNLKLLGFHAALIAPCGRAEEVHPLSVIIPELSIIMPDGADIGPELARAYIPYLAIPGGPEGIDVYRAYDEATGASLVARFALFEAAARSPRRALALGILAIANLAEDDAKEAILLEPTMRGYDDADKTRADFAAERHCAGTITLREAIHMAVTPVQVDTGTGPDCDTREKLYNLRRLLHLGVLDGQRAVREGAMLIAKATAEEA